MMIIANIAPLITAVVAAAAGYGYVRSLHQKSQSESPGEHPFQRTTSNWHTDVPWAEPTNPLTVTYDEEGQKPKVRQRL